MNQRRRFIADYLAERFAMTELCARYDISRKTGYKWLERFEALGPPGLADRSRRPHHCPHATPPHVVAALIELRRHHPTWGPKKLLARLARCHPGWPWPAPSTAHDLLTQHGLVRCRSRRRRRPHPGRPQTPMTAPNTIWTADFKGQFRTRDGQYCFPLTVVDGFSRYLLACQTLQGTTHAATKRVFRRLFQEYGLPQRIRTDNGVPFATSALGRLSRLAVWWIRLGILPELIEPSHPEQNGRHERMHRTLKAETTRPPAATHRRQQQRFSQFRREYNEVRPHEALQQRPPSALYQPSPRPYPERLPPLEYPGHFEVRRVSRNGGIRWHKRWVNVSHVLGEQHVGLEEIDDSLWTVYFGPLTLGRFHERTLRIEDATGRFVRRRNRP
jgi:transposase InsO family protein